MNIKTLCETYRRIEEQIQIRQNKLVELEQQIRGIIDSLPAKLQEEIEVPESLKITRQRITKFQEAEIATNMRLYASQSMTFTKPQMVDRMQLAFPEISKNILNRIFEEMQFTSEGRVDGIRGRPHFYSYSQICTEEQK